MELKDTKSDINHYLSDLDKRIEEYSVVNHSFFYGDSAVPLYYYYRYLMTNSDELLNKAVKSLEAIINENVLSDKVRESPFLINGIGIYWLYNFFIREGLVAHNIKLELYFTEIIVNGQNAYDYDLMHGFIGQSIALLESDIVDDQKLLLLYRSVNLIDSLQLDYKGLSFVPSFNQIKYEAGKVSIIPKYNLGMAHGMASIISFLSIVWSKLNDNKSKRMSYDFIKTIMQIEKNRDKEFRFESFYDSKNSYPSRLAWCYCDLGIVLSLSNAAFRFSDKSLHIYAKKIAYNISEIPAALFNIEDSSLCHGVAGIALMYARLYNYYYDPIFKTQTLFWSKELSTRVINRSDKSFEKFSFIDGEIGIALSLISLSYPIEPRWDRLLLLK